MTGFQPLVRANFLASARNKTELFFTFAFPLLFIVVFGLIFGSEKTSNGGKVIDLLAPGVMAWGVGNAALFGVAYSLVKWRDSDLLRALRRTPTSVMTLLGARLVIVLGTALVQAALFLAVAMTPPFGLHVSAIGLLLTVPALLCGNLVFFSLGVAVGNVCRTPDAVAAVANCVMLPMAFLSGSFLPLDGSPGWLRLLSHLLPLRYLNQSVTNVLSAGDIDYVAWLRNLLILLTFTAIFAGLAARTYRWENRS